MLSAIYVPVAQPDRVFDYESKGQGFESLLARHTHLLNFVKQVFLVVAEKDPFLRGKSIGIYKNRIDYMIVPKMFDKCCIDFGTGLGTKTGRNRVDFTTDSDLLFPLKRRFVQIA